MTAKGGRDICLHWPQHKQRIKKNLQTFCWWRRLRLRNSYRPTGASNAVRVLIWRWAWRRLCSHELRRNTRTISVRLLEDAGAPQQHKASWAIDKSVQPWYSMKIRKLWFGKKKMQVKSSCFCKWRIFLSSFFFFWSKDLSFISSCEWNCRMLLFLWVASVLILLFLLLTFIKCHNTRRPFSAASLALLQTHVDSSFLKPTDRWQCSPSFWFPFSCYRSAFAQKQSLTAIMKAPTLKGPVRKN